MSDTENMVLPVEDAKKPVSKMAKDELQAYIAKLEEEKAELQAQVAAPAPVKQDPAMTPAKWLEERLPFKAIKDNGSYKDDLVVFVNGQRFQIQRGKLVMIPRKVFLAIDAAERQMAEYAEYAGGLAEQAEARIGHM